MIALDCADLVPSLWMAPCEPLAKLAQLDVAQFRSGSIGRNAAVEITRATSVGGLVGWLVARVGCFALLRVALLGLLILLASFM